MQVAARGILSLKVAGAWESQPRFSGRTEIGRSSDNPGKVRCDGIENFGRRLASRYSLFVGRKYRNIFRPVLSKLSLLNLIDLGRKLWELFPVLREFLLPLFARLAASASIPD